MKTLTRVFWALVVLLLLLGALFFGSGIARHMHRPLVPVAPGGTAWAQPVPQTPCAANALGKGAAAHV